MKTKLSQTAESELTAKLLKWHGEAEEGNTPMFKRMSKCERYKVGRQWSNEDLDWSNTHRKHAVTINRVMPAVLQVAGHEVQNPRDINVKATKSSTKARARILMGLIKNMLDASQAGRKKSAAFDDGLTTGRGYVVAERSYDRDPKGDWVLRHQDPFQVLIDSNRTTYDLNELKGGARFIIMEDWEPKDYIEALYPKAKDLLGSEGYNSEGQAGMWGRFTGLLSYMFGGKEDAASNRNSYRDEADNGGQESVRRGNDSYAVQTYWWKTWEKGAYVQRLDEPDWYTTLHKSADIKYAKEKLQASEDAKVRVIETTDASAPVMVPVLHWAKMVGGTLVDYELDPLHGISKYPVFPFSPYFYHGYEFGLVDNLMGPQDVVNSSWSRFLNVLKQVANPAWKVRKATDQMLRWLNLHGNEDGVVLDESQFGGKVERVETEFANTQLADISDRSTEHMAQIANVSLENQDYDAKNISGRALALTAQSRMTGSAILFANYDWTMELMGEFLIEATIHSQTINRAEIESLIEEEELIDATLLDKSRAMIMTEAYGQIIPEPEAPDPVMVEGLDPQTAARWWMGFKEEQRLYAAIMAEVDSMAEPMAKAMLLDEFDNLPKGRYGVKVNLSESASTHRAQNFMELMELHKTLLESQQPGVPRDVLVKAADVTHQEEIIAASA